MVCLTKVWVELALMFLKLFNKLSDGLEHTVKLSPNSTITEQITQSVLNAGGLGVSATNTMYSFMDPDNNL